MPTDADVVATRLDELEASAGAGGGVGPLAGANGAVCAVLRREERLQYLFMAVYQVLVLILAAAMLILLVSFFWRIDQGETIDKALKAAGAVVTGTGALFLLRQRKDARLTHDAAVKGLTKHKCPAA